MAIPGSWNAATIPNLGTTSAEIDLGRDYNFLGIQIPTLDSPTVLQIQVAEKAGGAFYNLENMTTTSGAGNFATVLRMDGWRYIKIVADNAQTADRLIRVRGMIY